MKKFIVTRLLAIIVVAAFSFQANAQDLAISGSKPNSADLYTDADEFTPTAIPANEIDKRVLKAFQRSYGRVNDSKWFKLEKGFGVSFKNEGKKTVVFYASNGVVDSRILYYGADKLPSHVYSLVRTNFPDFTVSHVAEVHKNEVVAHLVKIQDKHTVKTMKVIGDDWEITETLVKN